MDENFAERKKEFEQILDLMKSIKKLSVKTKKSIGKINDLYIGLTEKTNDPVELFGLDFFNFQYEIYCKQYDNQMLLLNFLNNRIYGDYYKLYRLILMYVKSSITSDSLKAIVESNSNLPKYDKLNDTVVYPEEVLKTINTFVLSVLEQIFTFYKEKMTNMNSKVKLSKKGFCIGNFVTTVKHKNEMIKHQIELYEGYVKFFNENHIKQLLQVKDRLQKIFDEISTDVSFAGDVDISDDDTDDEEEVEDGISDITGSVDNEGVNLLISPKMPHPLMRQKSTDAIPVSTIVNNLGDNEVKALKVELKDDIPPAPTSSPSSVLEQPNPEPVVLICEDTTCPKKPFFNHPGETKGRFCKDHKKEGMVYIKKNA
tara:strand:- start:1371 stop:2480 length:1110 start_codon:yes stop_codon:yes gene_type:complete